MLRAATLILVVSAFALGSSIASASLLIEDGFAAGGTTPGTGEYQSDPASTNGTNNDSIADQSPDLTGWNSTDNWSGGGGFRSDLYGQIADTGLTYTDASNQVLDSTAGHLRFNRGITHSVARSTQRSTASGLKGNLPNSGVYISVLLQIDVIGTAGFLAFEQGGSLTRYLGIEVTSAGNLEVGSYNLGGNPAKNIGAVNPGEVNLVVARFYENNQLDVWLNPTDLNDSSNPDFSGGDSPGYVGGNPSYGLDTVTFNFGSGGAGETIEFDELRVATTFQEAVPFTLIPEPASAVLIGLGGVLMLSRRRRV